MWNSVRSVVYTLVVSLVFFTFAVATAQGGLATAFSEDWGEILVDAEGRSLYLYTLDADAAGGFACVDACINNWIPLLVPSLEGLHVGADIDMALVSLRQRAEGSYQVVYGDWPVYRSRRDAAAGTTRGQAVGSQFYLLNVGAQAVTLRLEQQVAEVSDTVFANLMEVGLTLYGRNCAACHGANGQGGAGPTLDGMQNISDAKFIASAIVVGRTHHGMPAFGPMLSDHEIAAIATYVRNAWSNEFGVVLDDEVAGVR